MQFAYKSIALVVTAVFIGASIFYFMNDQKDTATMLLWLSFFVYFSLYYLLKSLYYLRYSATFNEIIFVLVLPLVPAGMTIAKYLLTIPEYPLFAIQVSGAFSMTASIDWLDLLFIPYYLATIFLVMRTKLRYPFIRISGHSEKGIPSLLIVLLQALLIPASYFAVGYLYGNVMLLTLAVVIMVVAFLTLIA